MLKWFWSEAPIVVYLYSSWCFLMPCSMAMGTYCQQMRVIREIYKNFYENIYYMLLSFNLVIIFKMSKLKLTFTKLWFIF